MQALVLESGSLRLDLTRARPEPAAGEALIRPTRMGICGTDLQLCQNPGAFQGVLGHEFVGVVEAVGPKRSPRHARSDTWIGRRVVGTIATVCGRCDLCRKGLREHCRDRTELGLRGRDGVLAEAFTLPIENLLPVPDGLDDDRAVFAEPLAAALQILRQLTIEGRPFITVLGDGRLGLLCAQVLSELNATVRCVGKHPGKLELCEKWQVKHRLLSEVGLRQDQDVVIDCTGSPSGLQTALGMVRPRGTIVMKTTLAPQAMPAGYDLTRLVTDEIHLIGSRSGPLTEALDRLASEQVDVLSLISRRMKLADGPDILKAAARPEALKVLVEP